MSTGRTVGEPTDPQTLATALRDLTVAAELYEQAPDEKSRARLRRVCGYVEMLLDRFVAVEEDIYPRYLDGVAPSLAREHA